MIFNPLKYIVLSVLSFFGVANVLSQNNTGTQAVEQLKLFQNKLNTAPGPTPPPSDNQTSQNPASALGSSQPPTPSMLIGNQPGIVQPTPAYLAQQQQQQQQQQLQQQTGSVQQDNPDANVIEELAYDELERQAFPMSETEIKKFRGKYQRIELAKTTVSAPPTPVATSQFVNLSPGSTPPVVRLSQGFVSSLVFLDSTGAPWPIDAYDLGDPSSFNIQWDKTSNTLMIQATKLYNYGNMAVRLEGLNTSVMLTLIPGQKEVDYRVDMRIQGLGPNAQMPVLGDGLPPSANRLLLHVLDGVPPSGSTRLTVSGGDARAWLFRNKMYIRTNLTILSPAWLATMTSADGMHAYEMQKSPVILVAWHGKVMQLKVEGL